MAGILSSRRMAAEALACHPGERRPAHCHPEERSDEGSLEDVSNGNTDPSLRSGCRLSTVDSKLRSRRRWGRRRRGSHGGRGLAGLQDQAGGRPKRLDRGRVGSRPGGLGSRRRLGVPLLAGGFGSAAGGREPCRGQDQRRRSTKHDESRFLHICSTGRTNIVDSPPGLCPSLAFARGGKNSNLRSERETLEESGWYGT